MIGMKKKKLLEQIKYFEVLEKRSRLNLDYEHFISSKSDLEYYSAILSLLSSLYDLLEKKRFT